MAYAEREFTCPGCGNTFTKRAPQGSSPSCLECGIKRSVEAMTQIHQRKGPFYTRYLAGLVAAGRRAERELAAIRAAAAGDGQGDSVSP